MFPHSVERTQLKELLLVSGSAKEPTKRLPEELINFQPQQLSPPRPPSPVSEESERTTPTTSDQLVSHQMRIS